MEKSAEPGVSVTPLGNSDIKFAEAGETQPSLGEIADRIYKLESSSGKNDQKCERYGLHNGYGYGQTVSSNLCFKSDDEARKEVIRWISEKKKDHSLRELLCRYNTGIKTEDCHYAEMFYNL